MLIRGYLTLVYMTGFAKRYLLFAHNFNAHHSPPLDGYDNRLTIHVCTIQPSALTQVSFFSQFDACECLGGQ